MATLKITLYKSKKYSDGTHPVMLQIAHNRRVKRISIGVNCTPKQWNEQKNRVRSSYTNHETVNARISAELAKADKVRVKLLDSKIDFTVDDLVLKIKGIVIEKSFTEYTKKLIEGLFKAKKVGNATNYKLALSAIQKFAKKDEIKFTEINYKFLIGMEQQHLAKGYTLNGLSVYLRAMRAIFNKAIKEDLISADQYPFRAYSIKQEKTKKRAITKDDLQKIIALVLVEETPIYHARNMFLFSFFTIGMSWVDMAHLKLSNIVGNRIIYKRSKTNKEYSIRINDKIVSILNYYTKGKKKESYIFPIIKRTNEVDIMKDIRFSLTRHNKRLKQIGEMAGISEHLTSYVARHSWASIANFSGIHIGIISQGLGHNDIKTTQTYLADFDYSDIDEANANIL